MNVLPQILTWSKARPAWQRDALRRILQQGELSEEDISELTSICKSEQGLNDANESAPNAIPLSEEHVGGLAGTTKRVSLLAIRDVASVNALANGAKLEFDPVAITVVYGDNGSGKSGYGRILKSACRARCAKPKIHPNIFTEPTGMRPTATVDYRIGNDDFMFQWTDAREGPLELGEISIFDSECASFYVGKKTDVAYTPFGLDVFPMLVKACELVKRRISNEIDPLGPNKSFDGFSDDTPAGNFIRRISSNTSVEELDRLCGDPEAVATRCRGIRNMLASVEHDGGKARACELRLKAKRFASILERAECFQRSFR